MNKRLSRILFIAFLVAAVSSYLVYRVVGNQRSAGSGAQTSKILLAAHDLQIGTLIKDADLKIGDWVGPLPKGAFTPKDTVVGRGVISSLYEGEPILSSRLATAGSGGGMASTIRPGMRAVALKVDDVAGVSGFVVAGMRVDVLISGTAPGKKADEGTRVKTVLQNIEVLSAGTNIQKDTEGKPVQVPVVNLLVTPDQAEVLSLASNQTHIQLVLRNPLDTDTTKTSGVAMGGLFSDTGAPPTKPRDTTVRHTRAPVPASAPIPARVFLVEIMNGSKKTEEKFSSSADQQRE